MPSEQRTRARPLLQGFVDAACELLRCEAASILVLEEETGLLKFIAAPAHQRPALQRPRVPLDASVAGTAYTQGRNVIVNDALNSPHIYREVDRLLQFETRSILAVPIRYGSQVLGVMEAVNKHGNAHYTGDDVTILERIAAYAAVALYSSALLDETNLARQDVDALERMKADFIAITSHELRTPLGLVLGHAALLREAITEEPYSRQLDAILRAVARLQKILDDVSSMESPHSGRGKLHWQVVDLGELLQTVCRSFQDEAQRKKIAMVVQTGERRPGSRGGHREDLPGAGQPGGKFAALHQPGRSHSCPRRAPAGVHPHLGAGRRRGHPRPRPATRL